MDVAAYFVQLGIVGLGIVAVFFMVVVGLPVYLYHRRAVMHMKGTHAQEVAKLEARIAGIEQRCNKLEEQVIAAHLLLDDERRLMDKKLAEILPDSGPDSETTARNRGTGRIRKRE